MKIKRYTAASMRSALDQVRVEQGPEAVILSSRRIPDGIEVIAAVDYDETLMFDARVHRTPAAPPAIAPLAGQLSPQDFAPGAEAARARPAVKSAAPKAQPPQAPAPRAAAPAAAPAAVPQKAAAPKTAAAKPSVSMTVR